MHIVGPTLVASPTDLANFLACRHKTALDRLVAEGRLAKPTWTDPLAEVLRRRGDEHERRYIERLRAEGLSVLDLGPFDREERVGRTLEAMRSGADVIVQAALETEGWSGYADVLRKVSSPSPRLGAWSYEAHDTKLSRETRAGTILQLCMYSDFIDEIQGRMPEHFRVVTPLRSEEYRFNDFGAYYRHAKARFLAFISQPIVAAGRQSGGSEATYPEPVDHCDVCRWLAACTKQRRKDDHLSFVAGLGRIQQTEFVGRGVTTLEALAAIPLPLDFKPSRGSQTTYETLREQARLQFEARQPGAGLPPVELLPLDTDFGLTQLPEPRPGDLFLDLEGDPFGRPVVTGLAGDSGREYLFGLGRVGADGAFDYSARWALTDTEEQAAFDLVMADIMTALASDPSIHVYHYAPYEPSAFKRLMGRYAMREADLDRLLRGQRFVDLYAIARHALRAGVERYSIKNLEPCYGFKRDVELEDAGKERRQVELALETGDLTLITEEVSRAVEGYNKDDCRSTLELRSWLESLRQSKIARGQEIPRPPLEPHEAAEDIRERQQRINDLRGRLLAGVPQELSKRTPEEQARYLLAYLLDWHYREDKVVWWEYFRLLKLSDEELLDEPAAVSGLEFVEHVDIVRNKKTGKPTGSVIDRYRYPPQEIEIRAGKKLKMRDETPFGEVMAGDRIQRTLDVKKGPSVADLHPASAFVHERFSPEKPAESIYRLGERVASAGFDAAPRVAIDLLMRRTARLRAGVLQPGASVTNYAVEIVSQLDSTTLPIQGPPGSGKTYAGAQMILALVRQGKRVGVTATGHKVIRNLFSAIQKEAKKTGQPVRLGHKVGDGDEGPRDHVIAFHDNVEPLNALKSRLVDVLGGTAWLWSRPEFARSVDVLFVDEAGQMSLANALAVSQAADNLVLLGDPQQLEQPQKGSHPDGVDVSALDHVLEGHQTMPADRGLFLPITWRLAPAICEFTSELFYEGKLASKPGLERQRLSGTRFDRAGLYAIDVDHDGCRSASDVEARLVTELIDELLGPGTEWIDEKDTRHPMTPGDILVVAAYNAQVSRIREALERADQAGVASGFSRTEVRAGTVDKFQGQEAPVVIYSMASSRPEDAPRGMEFLYSLNRLNVATSRATCACILVASPRLFEPDCKTPRQMRLGNALGRYRERALK